MVLLTKVIFYFYLHESFSAFSFQESLYAMVWGYKFDFAIAGVVAFLATLFDGSKKLFAFVGSLLVVFIFLLQIGDILYFNEANRHIGYEITDTFTDASSLFMTAYGQHTLLTFSSLIVALLLLVGLYRWLLRFPQIELRKSYIVQKLILIVLTVFFVRGMAQGIPLNPWQSNQIGEGKLANLALNSSYNVLYVLANSGKKLKKMKLPTVDKDEMEVAFKALYPKDKTKETTPQLKKPNIVFFFLESWSAVNMKSYGYPKSTTPFFDEMLKKSVHPKAMIASGHRTTEGIFATLVSFQNPLGRSVAKSNLQGFEYTSIIKILKNRGYGSAFFQGTSKETSGTGSLAQDLGFAKSYGKHDVKERLYPENHWGVQDVDLYNFSLKKIDSMKKPFVIGINGATTHDDVLPKGMERKAFSEDKAYNKQLNALHFADMALGEFVKKVEQKYPNTLFVFFADHCGGVKGNAFENYLIPFALYHKDLKPKSYDVVLSQRDITPTVYNLALGDYGKDKINFSGKSLLDEQGFFADYYHNGVLGWVESGKILELNLATSKEKCYDLELFKNREIECSDEVRSFKKRMLSFTELSQSLLFEGKTDKFIEYRNKK